MNVKARFDAGAIDYLTKLVTQRSLYEEQDNQIAVYQDQIAAFVQVRKALERKSRDLHSSTVQQFNGSRSERHRRTGSNCFNSSKCSSRQAVKTDRRITVHGFLSAEDFCAAEDCSSERRGARSFSKNQLNSETSVELQREVRSRLC